MELFTWQAKARQVSEVYEWVLGRREKPDFGMPFLDLRDGEPRCRTTEQNAEN